MWARHDLPAGLSRAERRRLVQPRTPAVALARILEVLKLQDRKRTAHASSKRRARYRSFGTPR